MIDTDKYEGHTEGPWRVVKPSHANATGHIWCIESATEIDYPPDIYTKIAHICVIHNEDDDSINAQLIADAPLLLAEVKRLREENEMLREELKNDDTGIKAIDGLLKAVGDRNEEVERLREENEKQNNVLTTLDEMIQRGEEHVELMKALEQGLGIPETWKEMVE